MQQKINIMIKNIMQVHKFLTLHFIKRTLWTQSKNRKNIVL